MSGTSPRVDVTYRRWDCYSVGILHVEYVGKPEELIAFGAATEQLLEKLPNHSGKTRRDHDGRRARVTRRKGPWNLTFAPLSEQSALDLPGVSKDMLEGAIRDWERDRTKREQEESESRARLQARASMARATASAAVTRRPYLRLVVDNTVGKAVQL